MELLTIRAGGFSATVDGCARDADGLWFVSMLGHQQAVRAIWARLVKGEAAYLSETELGGQPVPLAREAWGTWRFSGLRLPSGSAYHGMLVPELAAFAANRPTSSSSPATGRGTSPPLPLPQTAASTAAPTRRGRSGSGHAGWRTVKWRRSSPLASMPSAVGPIPKPSARTSGKPFVAGSCRCMPTTTSY